MSNKVFTISRNGELNEIEIECDITNHIIISKVNAAKNARFNSTNSIYFIDRIISKMNLTKSKTLLDVGCGKCSVTGRFKGLWDKTVGVDLNEDDIKIAKLYYDDVYSINAIEILKYFGEKSFDAVIALDFIEHLHKKESKQLVEDCEKIARKFVAFFFPLDALCAELREDKRKNESLMRHLCEWEEDEFIKMGYETFYYGGQFHHIFAIKEINK